MNNKLFLKEKGKVVYKRAEYPIEFYNLKKKKKLIRSNRFTASKLVTCTVTQSKRDLRKENF